jgi:hypothetical protein
MLDTSNLLFLADEKWLACSPQNIQRIQRTLVPPRCPIMDPQAIFGLTSFERFTKSWGKIKYFWIEKRYKELLRDQMIPGRFKGAPSGTAIS